ncbi:hypothetical protein CgunFtcFv8_004167 [Champsocephalus gunnari]|uniref:C2 domain-containing protein n=1 Tax=Champsocephalus gunnari TaxID=52237 RepID=A0AAN8E0V8_CHAGU|nr:hypothetical protein CgunFtcFv8_004167 [Champsocephalus gunnari]
MWVFEKIRESMESIPLELSRYMGTSEEDIFLSSKASLSHNLHNNILTPDKIPEFCLPPRLCKRSSTLSHSSYVKTEDLRKRNIDASMAWRNIKKPLPFSAEGYGLTGIFESPNTRRKESLFHSKRPVYLFDRSRPTAPPRMAKVTNLPKKTLLGFLPLFSSKSLSETGSTGSGNFKGAKFCPSLIASRETRCQERPQHKHVLTLQGRGRVHLYAEYTTFSTNTFLSLSTVRVRVESVEGLWDDSDRRTLNCAVSLCLIPGKLQQQEGATIRNCRKPVFKEDFFFTELRREDMQELQLRLKVVGKPAAGAMRRGTVIGAVTIPLSELLPLKKRKDE